MVTAKRRWLRISDRPFALARLTAAGPNDALFAVLFAAAVTLVASLLVIAGPLGRGLLPQGGFHFFPSRAHLVYHKPAEEMRYVFAVAFALAVAAVLSSDRLGVLQRVSALTSSQRGSVCVRAAGVSGRLAIIGIAIWAWEAQFAGALPTEHFGDGNLVVAVIIAAALVVTACLRSEWLAGRKPDPRLWRRWTWFAVAGLLTAFWLLPSVFRSKNLGPASLSVTYHLEFTFDDFVAVLNGRTPLVNYAEQYASLLPFLVWPVLRVGGAQIGTFTVTMCVLTLIGLLAVQRTLALVLRNEVLAFVLYVPFLATSLFFILRGPGGELFNWASYYAVFPMRYGGPYVLLWLCVRHLRGMRPRSGILVFAFAGLTLINNVEFGLPAFAAVVVATVAGGAPGPGRVIRRVKEAALGLALAVVAVSVLTLLRAGELPSVALWTFYSRQFGTGGYGLLPTPTGGFYLIMYMTFAGALVVAALRWRDGGSDRVYTAALAYAGVFGLGTGGYYMGRTNPGGLVVLFSIWALNVVLLGVLAMRAAVAWRPGSRSPTPSPSPLVVGGILVALGLASTAMAQFQTPWSQIRRIASSTPVPAPYDVSAAVAFVRRTAKPGERVVLLLQLGHLVALDAGVENVSQYSHPDGVVTYDQLTALTDALQKSGGTRFYEQQAAPEVAEVLAEEGFRSAVDPVSGIVEWQRPLTARGRSG